MENDNELPLTPEADDQKLLSQIIDFYARSLKEIDVGLNYLKKRGVTNSDAIERFRIGLSSRTLGPSLPSKSSKAGRNIRRRLERLGIYRNSGHEHFNGCIVFPIYSAEGTGRIVDIYGRKIGGKRLRKGTPQHMHLNSKREGVWNIEAFGPTDEIILCTSLFDALTFWNHGYRNVTCVFGNDEQAVLDDLYRACSEFRIRRVMTTCEALAQSIMEAGMDCFLLRFPAGLDVNSYANQVNDAAERLGAVIRKAEWIGNGSKLVPSKDKITESHEEANESVEAVQEEEVSQKTSISTEATEIENSSETVPCSHEDCEGVVPDQLAEPEEDEPIAITTPMPPAPQDVQTEVGRDEVTIQLGHRRYRVRGISKNLSFDQMKVNVLAVTDRGMFVDTFDLYSARHRRAFVQHAAAETGVQEATMKKDLGRVLLKLEELQDE